MTSVRLVPVIDGALHNPSRFDRLATALGGALGVPCDVDHNPLAAAFAWDPERRQYYSSALLFRLAARGSTSGVRWLGVTPLDLYVPVLTFVFGEAQLGGPAAIVSWRRLEETFYGLPDNPDVLEFRLLKESLHELGHTIGLRHCDNPLCVMASTHSVELLDEKDAEYCPGCRKFLHLRVAAS